MVDHEKDRPNARLVKKPEELLQVETRMRRGAWGLGRKRLLAIRSRLRRTFRRYCLARDLDKSKNGGCPRACEHEFDGQMTEDK